MRPFLLSCDLLTLTCDFSAMNNVCFQCEAFRRASSSTMFGDCANIHFSFTVHFVHELCEACRWLWLLSSKWHSECEFRVFVYTIYELPFIILFRLISPCGTLGRNQRNIVSTFDILAVQAVGMSYSLSQNYRKFAGGWTARLSSMRVQGLLYLNFDFLISKCEIRHVQHLPVIIYITRRVCKSLTLLVLISRFVTFVTHWMHHATCCLLRRTPTTGYSCMHMCTVTVSPES